MPTPETPDPSATEAQPVIGSAEAPVPATTAPSPETTAVEVPDAATAAAEARSAVEAASAAVDTTAPDFAVNNLKEAGLNRTPGGDDYPGDTTRLETVSPAAAANSQSAFREREGLPPVGNAFTAPKKEGSWLSSFLGRFKG